MRSSKPKPADAEYLEQALAEIASALRAAGVPWMMLGGIASIARGMKAVLVRRARLCPNPRRELVRALKELVAWL